MTLPTCMNCGGDFLPPRRASWWSYCRDCSAQMGLCPDPWNNPDVDWDAWAPVPDEAPHQEDAMPEPPRRGTDEWEEALCFPLGSGRGRR